MKLISILRNALGRCKDRWTHDWQETVPGVGNERHCLVCGERQVCTGVYQPDVDLEKMRQWQITQPGKR